MPRSKKYDETEVVNRAMDVFWKHGYAKTSARLLEREMNINLFSIYSSFHSKQGLFLECLRAYKMLNRRLLLDFLAKGTSTFDIKLYFLEFLNFTRDGDIYRGCLLINSAQELGAEMTDNIKEEIDSFAAEILSAFETIIVMETESLDEVKRKVNHLFASLVGIITTAKSLSQEQIDHHLELTFQEV